MFLTAVAVAPRAEADSGDLARARARANAAAADLSEAETVLGELDAEISNLEAQAAAAQERLNELREAVRQIAVRRYVNADAANLTYLDGDINTQARADTLSRYATQGSQDAIDDYTAASEDLEVAKAALAEKREAQRDAIAELEKKRKALTAELARLEKLERERQEAERKRREEAARKAAAAKAKASRSSRTVQAAASAPAPSAPIVSSSGFICPVQGPVAFVDSWGAARSGGRAHKGVDMMAPHGTPTVAPVSGVVTHRGNSVGGLSWHLNGDDGHYYYGTHLQSYANVGAGHVQAGTVIGYVGSSGNASAGAPHLHFEFHPNGGSAVNPYPLVRAAC